MKLTRTFCISLLEFYLLEFIPEQWDTISVALEAFMVTALLEQKQYNFC